MKYPFDPLSTCVHLRCKQMLYGGGKTAEEQEEIDRHYGPCDTTAYWCDRTQTGRGPDDRPSSREECSAKRCAGRSCFVGIGDLS
jgi:hypothetical protein